MFVATFFNFMRLTITDRQKIHASNNLDVLSVPSEGGEYINVDSLSVVRGLPLPRTKIYMLATI